MEKQQMLDKTAEVLQPFETQNLMSTIQNLTLQQIFSNWVLLLAVLAYCFLVSTSALKRCCLPCFFWWL